MSKLYRVEKVIGKRANYRNRTEYLIKWQDWTADYSTWQPISSLGNLKEMVKEYEDYEERNPFTVHVTKATPTPYHDELWSEDELGDLVREEQVETELEPTQGLVGERPQMMSRKERLEEELKDKEVIDCTNQAEEIKPQYRELVQNDKSVILLDDE